MGTLKQPKKPLVAVVDDDESIRDTTKDQLDSASFRTATFASAEAFLKSPRFARVSTLIADMRMPGMSGLELHHHLVASGNPIPGILVTAYPDEAVRARAAGRCDLLSPQAVRARRAPRLRWHRNHRRQAEGDPRPVSE